MLTAVICTVTGWLGGAFYVWVIWEDRVGTYHCPDDPSEPSGWVHDRDLYVRHQPRVEAP